MERRIDAQIARTQFGQIMDLATRHNDRFVVDRRGEPAVVIMSVQEFISTAAGPAAEKAWTGAKQRRLAALPVAEIEAEITAHRRSRKSSAAAMTGRSRRTWSSTVEHRSKLRPHLFGVIELTPAAPTQDCGSQFAKFWLIFARPATGPSHTLFRAQAALHLDDQWHPHLRITLRRSAPASPARQHALPDSPAPGSDARATLREAFDRNPPSHGRRRKVRRACEVPWPLTAPPACPPSPASSRPAASLRRPRRDSSSAPPSGQ